MENERTKMEGNVAKEIVKKTESYVNSSFIQENQNKQKKMQRKMNEVLSNNL